MGSWRVAATTAALMLLLAPEAGANTFHVAPGGDDEQDPAVCSVQAPCSFRLARVSANVTPDEDAIVLAGGTYDLQGDQTFDAPVVLEGVRGARPTLKGRSFTFAGASVVTDVSLVGTADDVVLHATSARLERVDATNAAFTSTAVVCALDGPDSVLADSACHASPDAFGTNAIELNRFGGDGDFVLRHVTALSGGTALRAYVAGTTNASVSDSILAGAILPGAATIAYDHSAWTNGALPGVGNLQAAQETIFPDLASGGVSPGAGSPTIDAGGASGGSDLAGNPHTLGTAPDMGALEWIPVAPTVTSGDAIAISAAGAVVAGTIDPGGSPTTYRVEYGPAGSGYVAAVDGGSAGAGTLAAGLQATIAGLAPGTSYHYRFVASNGVGTRAGEDRTFTTVAFAPAPAPAAPPAVTPAAKPKVTISLASNRRCLKTRSTSLRVKIARGGTITRVDVSVNNKRVKRVTRAADLKRAIKVSKLPKRAYTLQVRVKTKDGRTVKASRKYRTCSSSR